MNIVYLSPNATPNHYKFCVALKKLGATVLAIGEEVYDNLQPELKEALTEYYYIKDLHDYNALVKAMGYLTFKHGKIDHLDSHNEYWLETEAKLRTDFNIIGLKNDAIHDIKRKSCMKEVFKSAKIKVARGEVVHKLSEAEKLIKKTGYPVVAKPDIGVGALSTYKIRNDEELVSFFDTKPDVDYIMEEFVKGTIYSFDGLTDEDGDLVFSTAHRYSLGIMETVNDNLDVYYLSLRKIPRELEVLGHKTLKAFDVKGRFFHFEYFKTGSDKYVTLEVNMRPPGGYTVDMFNYANNVDMYMAWAEMVVNRHASVSTKRPYHCCYAARKSGKDYAHTHDEIQQKYGEHIMMHASVPGVFSTALGNEGYIFRSADEKKILEISRFIQQTNAAQKAA